MPPQVDADERHVLLSSPSRARPPVSAPRSLIGATIRRAWSRSRIARAASSLAPRRPIDREPGPPWILSSRKNRTSFRRLARYLSGGNSDRSSLAMPGPVLTSGERRAMTSPVQALERAGALEMPSW